MISLFAGLFASRNLFAAETSSRRGAGVQSPEWCPPPGDCHPHEVVSLAFHNATFATGATAPSPGKITIVTPQEARR